MKLLEIFDSKIKTEVTRDEWSNYEVHADIGDQHFMFSGRCNRTSEWEVAFVEVRTKNTKWGKERSIHHERTGKGMPLQVFSFVTDEINHLIDKYKPNIISFTGSKTEDDDRTKLYTKLAKRFRGYKTEVVDEPKSKFFKLVRDK